MKNNLVTNTKEEAKTNPAMRSWVRGGNPAAIERQEAKGQEELVNSEVLPRDIRPAHRAALEAFGVIFGEVVEGDILFTKATLPPGWLKQATTHAMHSNLLDERGRVRAHIFYKAAFYDRSANMHVKQRYTCEEDFSDEKENHPDDQRCIVKDAGTPIHDTGWVPFPKEDSSQDSWKGPARKMAEAWVEEHYPQWEDVSAYWGESG